MRVKDVSGSNGPLSVVWGRVGVFSAYGIIYAIVKQTCKTSIPEYSEDSLCDCMKSAYTRHSFRKALIQDTLPDYSEGSHLWQEITHTRHSSVIPQRTPFMTGNHSRKTLLHDYSEDPLYDRKSLMQDTPPWFLRGPPLWQEITHTRHSSMITQRTPFMTGKHTRPSSLITLIMLMTPFVTGKHTRHDYSDDSLYDRKAFIQDIRPRLLRGFPLWQESTHTRHSSLITQRAPLLKKAR